MPFFQAAIVPTQQAILPSIPYVSMLKDIILMAAAIFGVYKILNEIGNQRKMLLENQNIKEREDIRYKLNNFFGPMRALRTESKILYSHFALKEKTELKERKGEKIGFRTLIHFSEDLPLSSADKALFEQILEIEQKELKLIEKEGWTITNPQLTELIGKFAVHIRVLSLAYDKKLTGKSRDLKGIVYPREIDGALESETRKLRDRYNQLLQFSDRKAMELEKLASLEDQTVDYYNINSIKYYGETANIDMSEIYDPFIDQLKADGKEFGALILDAGCGVGRDTKHFINLGHRVVSFDASIEMVKICNQFPFSYCVLKSFDEIDYNGEFDAVWACASLVHVSNFELRASLIRLIASLKEGGILFFSLKAPESGPCTDSRRFYYYSKEEISNIVKDLSITRINYWETKGKREASDTWHNYLYKKT